MNSYFWISGYHGLLEQGGKFVIPLFLFFAVITSVLIAIAWWIVTTRSRSIGKGMFLDLSSFTGRMVGEQIRIRQILFQVPAENPYIELRDDLIKEKKAFDEKISELKSDLRNLKAQKSNIESKKWEVLYWFIKWNRFGNDCQIKKDIYDKNLSATLAKNLAIVTQVNHTAGKVHEQLKSLKKIFQVVILKYEDLMGQELKGEKLELIGYQVKYMEPEIDSALSNFEIHSNTNEAKIPWRLVADATRIYKRNMIACHSIQEQLDDWNMNFEESQSNLAIIDKGLSESKIYLQKATLNAAINWSEQVGVLTGLVSERNTLNGFPTGFDVDMLTVVRSNTRNLKGKVERLVPAMKDMESAYAEFANLIQATSQSLSAISIIIEDIKGVSMFRIDWAIEEIDLRNAKEEYIRIAEKRVWLPNEIRRNLATAHELNVKVRALEGYSNQVRNKRNFIVKIYKQVLDGEKILPNTSYLDGLKVRVFKYDIANWGKYQEFVQSMTEQLTGLEESRRKIQNFSSPQKLKPDQILILENVFQKYDRQYSGFIVDIEQVEFILSNIVNCEKKGIELIKSYEENANCAQRLSKNKAFLRLTDYEFVQYVHDFYNIKFEFRNPQKGLVEERYQRIERWVSEFIPKIDSQYSKIKNTHLQKAKEISDILHEINQTANVNEDIEIRKAKVYLSEGDSLDRAGGCAINEKMDLIENFSEHCCKGDDIAQHLRIFRNSIRAAKNGIDESFNKVESIRIEAQQFFRETWPPVRQNTGVLEAEFQRLKREWKIIQKQSDTLENKVLEYNRIKESLSSGDGLWANYNNTIRDAKREREDLDNMEKGLKNTVKKLKEWLNKNDSLPYDGKRKVEVRIAKIENTLETIYVENNNNSFSRQKYQSVYDSYRELIASVMTNIVINANQQISIIGDIHAGGDVSIKQQMIYNDIL